ncbi:hypothetical protein AB4254_08990 [Vibrio breoganii]
MNKKSLVYLLAMGLVATNPALAVAATTSANTIGSMAASAETNINAIKSFIINLFYLIGTCLVGFGLFMFYKDGQQPNQGHAKKGMYSCLIGVLLLLIPVLVGVFAGSVGLDSSKGWENVTKSGGF